MRGMKRILAMLLAVVMVVGLIPATVFAADADTDYLFFATDRHTNTSIIDTMINNMEKKIGENNLEYLGLGGDMVGSGNSHPTYSSSTVLKEVTGATTSLSAANVDIVAGIHDMNVTDDAGIVLPYSGGGAQIYEGDKYYVYGVPESCISGAVSGVDPETEANDFVTWANGSNIDKSKVIFVLSHYPLHQRRNDNDGAVYWAAALNEVAVGNDTTIDRDVAFFWGHNHTGESSADTAVYHVAPNGSISVQGGSSSQKIYFTYANAGYLNAKSSATLVEITDTTITFNKYTNSSYTTNTVTRVVQEAKATLTGISLSGTTEYEVGDELALTVTAAYDDGTTADVTAAATLSGYDMSTAGTYTVTAAYEGKTATIDITVAPKLNTITEFDDLGIVSVTATALGITALEVTNVYGDPDLSGTLDDYMSVDVALEGHTDGNEIAYKIMVFSEIPTSGLVLYHVKEDGTLTPITYELVTEGEGETATSFLQFNSTLTGIFAYGLVTVPEGYVFSSLEATNSAKKDYFVGDTLSLEKLTVVATYTKEGAEDFTRVIYIKDDYATFDGYAVSGYDMTQIGKQTVVVSYTDDGVTCTDSYEICVWGHEFTSGDVTVYVDGEEYGVTNFNVAPSTNENVATAVQHVLTGDNYVAYDLSLTYDTGYAATEDAKTVTLPIPAGVNNPVVYYVSDSGKSVVDMKAVNNGNNTVTFTTTHFSTFVVGDGTVIETESENAVVESTTTTTTKTVYVLTSSISSGKSYLIANSNSASTTTRYLLTNEGGNSSTPSATGVTILSGDVDGDGDTETYIELEDATDVLWTVAGSYTFANQGEYLRYSSGLQLSSSSTTWSYSSNRLSYRSGYTTRYLRYNNGWTTTTSSSNAATIGFYVPTEIPVTTGAPGHTYSVEGTDITNAPAISGVAVNLSSKLYDTPTDTNVAVDITESSGLTPTYEIVTTKGNPAVISNIENGVATLSGQIGTAVVKVTYTSADGTLTAWDEFIVTATNVADKDYSIDLTDGAPNFNSITAPITIKGITEGHTASVWAVVKAGDVELGTLGDALSWKVSEPSIASIDTTTGVITFTGEEGTVDVTVYYACPGGTVIEDTVTFSVTKGQYTVPEDGTKDFPEYPEPGAIRFDKNATAVGNFSQTGIVEVELSMTGVPYGNDTSIDVVVMLDMTGSMSTNGMAAAAAAAKAFVTKIVQNNDGTYNKNRVAVYQFNSSGIGTYFDLQMISSDSELETALGKISTTQSSGGTPFDEAAEKCQSVLTAAKTNLPEGETIYNRKQFCVFMSDGGPTAYYGSDGKTYYNSTGSNSSGDEAIEDYMTGYSSSDSSDWSFTLPTEYYTDAMKADGVTVYTVGLLLQNVPNNPAPYKSMTESTYDSTTDSLTTIGSHYYFTSAILKQMASDETKYIDIFSVDNASKATAAFESIAQSILDAATDVKVTDKIADAYTMVFEAPNATVGDALPENQEFYIEVKEYLLDPVYGTDGTTIVDYTRGTAASLMKLYLGKSGTTYYAASDASGTAYAAPTFNQVASGTMFYWTTTANTASGVSVTVDGTTYYFVAAGASNADEGFDSSVWYNMATGAYASGNLTTTNVVDDDSGEVIGTNSTCQDMIIATPYFVYNANTRMLVWTTAKLSTSELALSYFLYLNKSGGYSGAEGETEAGTYETNDYAYLGYTNFQKTDCQQTFPVPQMTWNGAQVSYVFYLVNSAGQPVNRAGKVVPFSEAVFVTDTYTEHVVWNDLEQVASLEAEYLAEKYVPEIYDLYDDGATYNIHVFEDENAQNLNNHFVIGAGEDTYTTYVFNTKSDATKYKAPGVYAANKSYKCKEYVENGTYEDENGKYNIVTKNDANVVETGFDFSNTTVAFAVVWKAELVDDVVVVDFGLDVVVDVITNDALAAGLVGVSATVPNSATINNGTYKAESHKTSDTVYIDANHDEGGLKELAVATVSVENQKAVRFSLDKKNGMQFNTPAVFYYEAAVNFYDGNNVLQSTNMYSSVTVIPATTVYYEDTFVTFSDNWSVEGTTSNKTQAVDRPGVNKLTAAYDADNVYGYDAAYSSVSTYSMGSARKVHVDANSYGTATFTFWGTGFDVIGMTSGDTGVLAVKVVDANDNKIAAKVVNTYYGYAYGLHQVTYTYTCVKEADEAAGTKAVYSWLKTSSEAVDTAGTDGKPTAEPQLGDTYVVYEKVWYPCATENALYQVPVMQASGLDYGKYTVTITATYVAALDQTTSNGYDLYLDAIRIYDPTGVVSGSDTNNTDGVVSDAYIKDGEAWPTYIELRDQIISAEDFNAAEAGQQDRGAIFIDQAAGEYTIAEYTSYGPNNELYLANGQAIAFNVAGADSAKDVQLGIKLASGDSVTYEINGDSYTVSTATDMYYSIAKYAKAGTVVIENVSGGILSLTNIKVTAAPAEAEAASLLWMDGETATFALRFLSRSPMGDGSDTGENEGEDTTTDNNTNNNTNTNTGNTGNNDNADAEQNGTVSGETIAPESNGTVNDAPETDEPAEEKPEEELPKEDVSDEEIPEDSLTTGAVAEQLGFWARLWNAIKNAFKRLFTSLGF